MFQSLLKSLFYRVNHHEGGNYGQMDKDTIEKHLRVQISIEPSRDPIMGKYRSEIKNGNFYVGYTANTPNNAFERALNIWIKYDRHTPYVSLENLVIMINNLPLLPEKDDFETHIFTNEGEMLGIFTLVDEVYKLYYFGKVLKKF